MDISSITSMLTAGFCGKTMMRMVVPLSLDFLHGIVPGHGGSRGPVNRIEVGLVRLIYDVLGEGFALVQNSEPLTLGFLN